MHDRRRRPVMRQQTFSATRAERFNRLLTRITSRYLECTSALYSCVCYVGLTRACGDRERKYALEASALEDAMKRRQKLLHPDKFSTKSERERRYSADQASAVNEAYGALRDPLRRAKYILEARGWGVTERDGRDAPVDPELLMEVMEAREAIDDANGNLDKLRELLREHSARVASCEEETRAALDATPMVGESAKDAVVRLTYFVRIVEEIKALL